MERDEVIDWMRDRGLFLRPGHDWNEVRRYISGEAGRGSLAKDEAARRRMIADGVVVESSGWKKED